MIPRATLQGARWLISIAGVVHANTQPRDIASDVGGTLHRETWPLSFGADKAHHQVGGEEKDEQFGRRHRDG